MVTAIKTYLRKKKLYNTQEIVQNACNTNVAFFSHNNIHVNKFTLSYAIKANLFT